MRTKPFPRRRIWLLYLALLLTGLCPAQFIEVKTVPLAAGTGRPGVPGARLALPNGGLMSSDLLIAPSGEVVVDEAIVLTHQFSVIIPLKVPKVN